MTCTRVATALTGQRSPLNCLYKPATCKRGLHPLAESGYRHAANDQENILRNIDRTTARRTRVSALVTRRRSIGLMQPSRRRVA